MGQLKTRAERWDEWHGTWLESTLNEFFDKYSVKTIKSEILRYILEDDADHDEVVHLMFYETVRAVSYTHLRAHETRGNLVCRLLLEK